MDEIAKNPNSTAEPSDKTLTHKQLKFLTAYQITLNGTQSAITAGYAEKSAAVEANRLLKNPVIKAEIDKWKAKKSLELSKEDYIADAYGVFQNFKEEPSRVRGLELTGKALGYVQNEQQNTTTTNVQINIDARNMSMADKWNALRKVLDND